MSKPVFESDAFEEIESTLNPGGPGGQPIAGGVSDDLRKEDVFEDIEFGQKVVELEHEAEGLISEAIAAVFQESVAGVGRSVGRFSVGLGPVLCAGLLFSIGIAAERDSSDAFGLEHGVPVKMYLTPLWHVEAAHDVQEGALSAAAGAHDRKELGTVDLEVDAAQDGEFGSPQLVALVHTVALNHGLVCHVVHIPGPGGPVGSGRAIRI